MSAWRKSTDSGVTQVFAAYVLCGVSILQSLLRRLGYTREISHGVLMAMVEHRHELEAKTKPILDTLRSYQDLPPVPILQGYFSSSICRANFSNCFATTHCVRTGIIRLGMSLEIGRTSCSSFLMNFLHLLMTGQGISGSCHRRQKAWVWGCWEVLGRCFTFSSPYPPRVKDTSKTWKCA